MMQVIDAITAGGLAVAQRVALRSLTPEEIQQVRSLDRELLERARRTLSRVRFTDQLRYTIAQSTSTTDIRDALQGFDRDALEIYLLCTCLDTLAGKDDFIDLPSWLRSNNRAYHGIVQRDADLDVSFAQPFERARYLPLIERLLNLYHQHYGVTKGIKDMVLALPGYIKDELSQGYRIYSSPTRLVNEKFSPTTS